MRESEKELRGSAFDTKSESPWLGWLAFLSQMAFSPKARFPFLFHKQFHLPACQRLNRPVVLRDDLPDPADLSC